MIEEVTANIRYWMALNSIKGVGSRTASSLLKRYKRPEKIFAASRKDFEEIKGLRAGAVEDILGFSNWRQVDREIEKNGEAGVCIATWEDACYPKNLLNIHDPPIILYIRGELDERDNISLGIVGSRNASAYGLEMAETFASRLGEAGITIVSGFARGIDTMAHKGALHAGGRTIAVLGSGLDVIYPGENKGLFGRIIRGSGAVVSEFPLGTRPDGVNFPKRNRIISGLSAGLLVVEASEKSGSLITAGLALDQGREVFAVPGNANALRSRGTNNLIKQGAKLVERPEEILSEIVPSGASLSPKRKKEPVRKKVSLSGLEEIIYASLEPGPLHIDEVAEKTAHPAPAVSAALLSLELQGIVRQRPGKLFSLI